MKLTFKLASFAFLHMGGRQGSPGRFLRGRRRHSCANGADGREVQKASAEGLTACSEASQNVDGDIVRAGELALFEDVVVFGDWAGGDGGQGPGEDGDEAHGCGILVVREFVGE